MLKTRIHLCWLLLIIVMLIFNGVTLSANDFSKTTVAVVDFTDNSGKKLRGIGEASSEILSTLLVQTGKFNVVERSKLRTIITEQGFNMSGLVDSNSTAVQVGKLLGANYLATGSIVSYGTRTLRYEGYGITSEKFIAEMSVNVKILNITTGNIEFASIFSAQNETLNTSNIVSETSNHERILLQKALTTAVTQLVSQLEAQMPVAPEKVMVTFDSEPAGADIEIDNVFYGNTPVSLSVNAGLHQVKISYAGYEPWVKTINAFEGLSLKATLEKKKK